MLPLLLAVAVQVTEPKPSPRPAEIVVRAEVVDGLGAPIVGAECRVSIHAGGRPERHGAAGDLRMLHATTDRGGRFEFRVAPELAKVDLSVSVDERVPEHRSWYVGDDGGVLDAGTIVLDEWSRLQVSILDTNGELEQEGWNVTLVYEAAADSQPVAARAVQEAGCFQLDRGRSGAALVDARNADGTRLTDRVELVPGRTSHLVLRRSEPSPARCLGIRFVDRVDGVTLVLDGALTAVGRDGDRQRLERRPDGTWSSGAVMPQRYALDVKFPGLEPARVVLLPGRAEVLELRGQASLRFRLVDLEGTPIESGRVEIGDRRQLRYAAQQREVPSVHVLGGLIPRSFAVRATAPGFRPYFGSSVARHEAETVDLVLAPTGILRGFVRRPDGTPASGVLVQATTKWTRDSTAVRTDAAGEYQLPLVQRDGYRVGVVSGPGSASRELLRDSSADASLDLRAGWVLDLVGRVDLRAGERTTDVAVLAVEGGSGSVHAAVASGARAGGGGAEVTAAPRSGPTARLLGGRPFAMVQPDGRFELPGVDLDSSALILVRIEPDLLGRGRHWQALRALARLERPPSEDPVWRVGVLDLGVVGGD